MPSTELAPYLDNAQSEGALSDATRKLLEKPAVQRNIALAMGTPSSQIPGRKEVLVTILIDDSGSLNKKKDAFSEQMVFTHNPTDPEANTQAVRETQNIILDGLQQSDSAPVILVSTQALNSGVLDPYHPLSQALRLNAANFRANGQTPLYRRTLEVLGGVLLKDQEAADQGWKDDVRTITFIVSDGGNSVSRGMLDTTADEVAQIAIDLQENGGGRHIIAAVALDDGTTPFVQVFMGMGIKRDNIMFAADKKQLLERVKVFTKATVKAANASQEQYLMLTDGGGFGAALAQSK